MDKGLIRLALKPQGRTLVARTRRCIQDGLIAAYVEGSLNSPARESIESHLADCEFCLQQVASVTRIWDETPPKIPSTLLAYARRLLRSDREAALFPTLRWVALGGATVSAVLVAALWLPVSETVGTAPPAPLAPQPQVQPAPPLPTPPEPRPAVRSVSRPPSLPELTYPQNRSTVPATELEFRWKEVERSVFYEVHLVTSDGSVVWQGRSKVPRTKLPTETKLTPGRRYFVWIRAYMPEGNTQKSKTISFAVEEKR